MLQLIHIQREHAVEGADVTVTYAGTGVFGASSFGGGGFSYHRPVLVRHSGRGVVIPIRDHVMVCRLATVAILLAAGIWRWFDDR